MLRDYLCCRQASILSHYCVVPVLHTQSVTRDQQCRSTTVCVCVSFLDSLSLHSISIHGAFRTVLFYYSTCRTTNELEIHRNIPFCPRITSSYDKSINRFTRLRDSRPATGCFFFFFFFFQSGGIRCSQFRGCGLMAKVFSVYQTVLLLGSK